MLGEYPHEIEVAPTAEKRAGLTSGVLGLGLSRFLAGMPRLEHALRVVFCRLGARASAKDIGLVLLCLADYRSRAADFSSCLTS